MRGWPIFAVLVVAIAVLAWPDAAIEPTPVERGLAALHASGARDAHALEAVLAAGIDPRDWRGADLLAAVEVPGPSEDPIEGLYEMVVVLQADIDPTAWQDPVRGQVDLLEQLLANVPRALESRNDAVQSFQLLAMAHGGLQDHESVPALRDLLLDAQYDDGSWGCGPWVGPECTSYALRALAATGGIPEDVRLEAIAYIESRRQGDAYSDPLNGVDLQITANAIRGLVAAGIPPPQAILDALVAQQVDGMWLKADQPSRWATSEVLVALSEAGAR